jgi:Zn-dependent protease with chaperone function
VTAEADPIPHVTGLRRIDRTLQEAARRTTAREFDALAGRPVTRPGWSATRVLVTLAAVVLHLAFLAVAATGLWLCAQGFPGVSLVPGVILLLVAYELRPRFGQPPEYGTTVGRDEAPALHDLVDRVAAALDTPRPDIVVLTDELNASAGTVGWRRRRCLAIGLPLWSVLTPPQRVALLGHELGHFVNGDVRRGLLVQPVFTTLAVVDSLLAPSATPRESGLVERLATAVWGLLAGLLREVLTLVRLVLVGPAQRDAQRAEYLADAFAARLAGTVPAVAMLDLFASGDTVAMVAMREARKGSPAAVWREETQRILDAAPDDLAGRRQRSVETGGSFFASHPPAGLRAALLESRPAVAADLTLTAADNDRIDAQLDKRYRATARDLANR